MTFDRKGRPFRLLMTHCIMWSLGMSLAAGFVDAFILRLGFGMAATLGLHAVLLVVRFCLRAVALPLVRRLGMRAALLLGAAVAALQFLPLTRADRLGWLIAWILIVSFGECIYWPICHAATAVLGGRGRRGRQIAFRQMAGTLISVIGPVVGGIMLTRIGPAVEFTIASVLTLASVIPLFWIGRIDLGRVPALGASVRAADPVGLCAFAADGWLCAGIGIAWPMVVFSSLGSSYDALGWASSAAAVAGSLAGLGCGVAIDRGYRDRLSQAVTLALLFGILLRVVSAWAPWAVLAASATGAAVGGLYVPLLMSVIYDRAKRSGSAYQFHLSAEVGWDAGCILGCLTAAAVALTAAPASFAVLPSALGLLLVHRCIAAESRSQPALGQPVGRVVAAAA